MTSAAPTILALETASAWVVIIAVSLVSLLATVLLRKIIGRPGGVASGLLLSLPLVVPLCAAVAYARQFLPEVEILAPAGRALLEKSNELTQMIRLYDDSSNVVMPLAVKGSAGPWLLVIGLSVSSFMLIRRVLGWALMRRLIARCELMSDELLEEFAPRVRRFSEIAGLKRPPELLVLPIGVSGVFAVGTRRARILISDDLLRELDRDELDSILAHEVSHIEAHDIQVVFTAGLLRDVVAWNPIAHIAYRRLVIDRETKPTAEPPR